MRGMSEASSSPTATRSVFSAGSLVALLGVYVAVHFHLGTLLIAQTNRNRLATDQQNNIELALKSRADPVPMRTDGVVNPLWPWVASRFATENQEAFFARGRWFNLAWTAMAACVGSVLVARALPLSGVAALLFAGGLGALLPAAVWFQPEPLYFVLFATTGALAWTSLRSNPLPLYAALGGVAGLAYLAKASVTLLLVAWAGASVLRWGVGLVARERWAEWRPLRFVAGSVVMGALFAGTLLPRAIYSAEKFGDPLHSYTKYWMWHDDFGGESVPFMAAHPDAASLRAMTPDQRPGPANYVARHGWGHVWQRLSAGVRAKLSKFLLPDGRLFPKRSSRGWKSPAPDRGLWLVPPMLVCAGFAVAGCLARPARAAWDAAGWCRAAFALAGLLLYTFAYGWYHPIGRGDRFMMSLYLPLLAVAVFGAFGLAGRAGRWPRIACWVTVALVLIRMVWVVADPVFSG